MIKGQSWCQSSCINSKNLLGKKFEPKMIILVFLPLGVVQQGTTGYLVRKNSEKKSLKNILLCLLFHIQAGVPIQGSRVAMLRGSTAVKCGSCSRWWGKRVKKEEGE